MDFPVTDTCPCRKIKHERSDAGRRGRASLRCSRGRELVASSAHPCSRTGVFGSDCSSSHNSAADGRWRSPKTITWSKQSRRIEPIARSQYPFCQGERAAVGRSRMPIARIPLIKASPYTRSRSRNRYFGGFSQPVASVTCCAIHSAVGCAVTPNHRISRRSCRRINRPNRSRNDSVGTTNRSSAAIPSA